MKKNYKNLKLINNSGILQITLSRSQQLNALSTELLNELQDVLNSAQNDKTVKALLIIGEGNKAFCAGADINQLVQLDAQQGIEFAQKGQAILNCLEQFNKPSLAAINGYAFGGGCELAMATSMRIASDNAKFAQPEIKLGVIPGYGGTQRLARLIGKGRAIDLCITGCTISANDALNWGLVSEITTQDNLLPRAYKILQNITSLAPLAIDAVIKTINIGYDLTLENGLAMEAKQFGLLCATQDKQEGISAFLQKRKAEFKGK